MPLVQRCQGRDKGPRRHQRCRQRDKPTLEHVRCVLSESCTNLDEEVLRVRTANVAF